MRKPLGLNYKLFKYIKNKFLTFHDLHILPNFEEQCYGKILI